MRDCIIVFLHSDVRSIHLDGALHMHFVLGVWICIGMGIIGVVRIIRIV